MKIIVSIMFVFCVYAGFSLLSKHLPFVFLLPSWQQLVRGICQLALAVIL
jgi:hypothetical protein